MSYSTTQYLVSEKPEIKHLSKDKFETLLSLPKTKNNRKEGGLRTQNYYKKSNNCKPLVSIFTVVFNGEMYLEETIKSVINQSYDHIEFIIVDGGSTDGTIELIKKYEDQIDYWVSEKDKGIYDAMNKGLILSTGDYIGVLNADDYYHIDAVKESIQKILTTQSDYSVGKVQFINSKIVATPIFPMKDNYIYQEMTYPHISAFIAKEAYKSIGLFNDKYKIAGDFDMSIKIHLSGYKACYVDNIIIGYLQEGGISSSTQTNLEFLNVVIANGKPKLNAYLEYLFQIFKMKIHSFLPNKTRDMIMKLKKSRYEK